MTETILFFEKKTPERLGNYLSYTYERVFLKRTIE